MSDNNKQHLKLAQALDTQKNNLLGLAKREEEIRVRKEGLEVQIDKLQGTMVV